MGFFTLPQHCRLSASKCNSRRIRGWAAVACGALPCDMAWLFSASETHSWLIRAAHNAYQTLKGVFGNKSNQQLLREMLTWVNESKARLDDRETAEYKFFTRMRCQTVQFRTLLITLQKG